MVKIKVIGVDFECEDGFNERLNKNAINEFEIDVNSSNSSVSGIK